MTGLPGDRVRRGVRGLPADDRRARRRVGQQRGDHRDPPAPAPLQRLPRDGPAAAHVGGDDGSSCCCPASCSCPLAASRAPRAARPSLPADDALDQDQLAILLEVPERSRGLRLGRLQGRAARAPAPHQQLRRRRRRLHRDLRRRRPHLDDRDDHRLLRQRRRRGSALRRDGRRRGAALDPRPRGAPAGARGRSRRPTPKRAPVAPLRHGPHDRGRRHAHAGRDRPRRCGVTPRTPRPAPRRTRARAPPPTSHEYAPISERPPATTSRVRLRILRRLLVERATSFRPSHRRWRVHAMNHRSRRMKRLLVLTTAVLALALAPPAVAGTYDVAGLRRGHRERLLGAARLERLRHRLHVVPWRGHRDPDERRLRAAPRTSRAPTRSSRRRPGPASSGSRPTSLFNSQNGWNLGFIDDSVRWVWCGGSCTSFGRLLGTRHPAQHDLAPRTGHVLQRQRLPALQPGRHPRDAGHQRDDRRPDAAECRDHGRVGDAVGVAERRSGRAGLGDGCDRRAACRDASSMGGTRASSTATVTGRERAPAATSPRRP